MNKNLELLFLIWLQSKLYYEWIKNICDNFIASYMNFIQISENLVNKWYCYHYYFYRNYKKLKEQLMIGYEC